MAIKISGNTVIDDSQNITATGSGTFGGEINIGGYNGNSTTTDGVLLGSVGGVYSQLADGNPTGVLFQGMHGSTFTSRITAAGSAMFANDITLDRPTAPSDVKISGSDTHAVWLSDGNFALKYDGSATFKGETIVQGTGKFFLKRNDAGSTSCAIRDDNLRIFDNPVSYDDFKISLENDGSATFASGGSVINSYGQLVITRSDSNAYPSLTINSAGTTTNTIDLNGDGSATFAGTITSNGGVSFTGGQLVESVNVTAGTLASASDIDLSTGMVHYFTTQESTQVTPNLMVSGKSVNQIMAVGEAISVVIMLTASASGYMSSLTIDGSPVTPMWSNGIAPSEGGASGIDVYSLQIIKTANSTYTVIANSSNFA